MSDTDHRPGHHSIERPNLQGRQILQGKAPKSNSSGGAYPSYVSKSCLLLHDGLAQKQWSLRIQDEVLDMIASIVMILVGQKILVIKPQRWRATRHVPHRLLLVPRRVASHPLFALRWCISAVHITEDRKETGECMINSLINRLRSLLNVLFRAPCRR